MIGGASHDTREALLPLVIADMTLRVETGAAEYGEPLTTHNGRNGLRDAYEEALDLSLYLRQELVEREALAADLVSLREELAEAQEIQREWAGEAGKMQAKSSELEAEAVSLREALREAVSTHRAITEARQHNYHQACREHQRAIDRAAELLAGSRVGGNETSERQP